MQADEIIWLGDYFKEIASGFYGKRPGADSRRFRRIQAEENRVSAWQAAIAKRDAQLDRGEGEPYTPELMERMTQLAIDTMHRSQSVDPDAVP